MGVREGWGWGWGWSWGGVGGGGGGWGGELKREGVVADSIEIICRRLKVLLKGMVRTSPLRNASFRG